MFMQVDSERKEQFISDLLQNCKGIRLDSAGPNRPKDGLGQGPASFIEGASNEPNMPMPESVDDIQVPTRCLQRLHLTRVAFSLVNPRI